MAHSVVDVAALGDSVRVLWTVDASDCLRASASAAYAERLLLIEIARSGDPLMDCVPGTNPKRYEATTAALPSGTYDVRVIDASLGRPRTQVGRATVTLK